MPLKLPRGYVPVCIAPLYAIAQALRGNFPAAGNPTLSLRDLGFLGGSLITLPEGGRRVSYGLVVKEVEASLIGVELELEGRDLPRPKPSFPRPWNVPARNRAPKPEGDEVLGCEDEEEAEASAETEAETRVVVEEVAKGAADKGEAERAAVEAVAMRPSQPLRFSEGIAITLVPPYRGSLLSEHLGPSARALGLVGLACPLPKGVGVTLPQIADMLGAEVREALCDGIARTILVEEKGDLIDIPARFWRSEEAEKALAADEMVTVPLPKEGEARGVACIERNALDEIWTTVRARMPGPEMPTEDGQEPGPMVKPALSPAMEFMLEVAAELKYSRGKPYGKLSLAKSDIAQKIREKWKYERLGDFGEALANAMAILIMHPSDRKGGAPDAEERQLRLVYRENAPARKRNAVRRLRAAKEREKRPK